MIHKIKALHDNGNGLGIRAIARQLRVSRNTVKKYLEMSAKEIQEEMENTNRIRKLDDHREYIIHLLETFPDLSAVKVMRKLKEKYPDLGVSDRSARRYIKDLKDSISLKQKRYYEPVLDMVPGTQCQVDGGELRGVLVGGVESVIHFVVFVLSYSRMMYVGLSSDPINTDTFIQMHDAAFRYFGGRPEECVYDQTKLVVLHEEYRELTLNPRFQAYATAAEFRIHACEGYDPESKGKVEAGVKYVKGNALYGEVFESWSLLEQYMLKWLDETANVRIHGSTGEPPIERYDRDERQHMGQYLTPSYITRNAAAKHTRKADKTGLISWKSNKYSVPIAWQQARVGVRIEGARLSITDLETGKEIADHGLSQGKGNVIKNKDHYRDKREHISSLESAIQQQVGADGGKQLCDLLKRTNGRIYKDQLTGLKALLTKHAMPPKLLGQLCDRPTLATSQIRDYLEAYAAHPERFNTTADPDPGPKDGGTANQLSQYSGIAQQHEEGRHDQFH